MECSRRSKVHSLVDKVYDPDEVSLVSLYTEERVLGDWFPDEPPR
jgi:hypothetical protein